jgi:hypothetical protein
MLGRSMLRLFGGVMAAAAGYRPLSGRRYYADATAGSITWTPAMLAAGWISRSGQVGAIGDTTPTADSILAAFPDLSRGDSFEFRVTSTTANANTVAAGTGVTLAGTTAVAASTSRDFLMTLLSEPKRTVTVSGSTTNASAVLSNISQANLANIGVGMLVTGTGIAAAPCKVLAVNLTAGTVTLDGNSTATADNIGITFTPNFELRGIGAATL